MNSRTRRRFNVMGFGKNSPKDSNGKFTEYEGYVAPSRITRQVAFKPVTESEYSSQKAIIQQAKNMYLGGKHLGSKPLQTIKNRIHGVSEAVGARRAYMNALKKAQEALKEQEVEKID